MFLLGCEVFSHAEAADIPATHARSAEGRWSGPTFLFAHFGCVASVVGEGFWAEHDFWTALFWVPFWVLLFGSEFLKACSWAARFPAPKRGPEIGPQVASPLPCVALETRTRRSEDSDRRGLFRDSCGANTAFLQSGQQKTVPFVEHVFVLIWLTGSILGAARRHLFRDCASAGDRPVGQVLFPKKFAQIGPPGGFSFRPAWRTKCGGQKAALKIGSRQRARQQ